jgi:hypothetical protein|tara:strand:+ start:138 stop:860 length:723 start_codon:yes stop_codon:yes gene_type:complete
MASTYTSRIRLEKQADGENPNSWGLILNQNVIDLVDEAVAGYHAVSVSSVAVSLTSEDGTTDQSRKAGFRIEGTLTADVTISFPAQEKTYFIHNGTTGDYNVLLKAGAGTAVTATGQGLSMMVGTDGTTINTIKSEDNDSKIYNPFLVTSTLNSTNTVTPSAGKSIYQRVNTTGGAVTITLAVGNLSIGQYIIIDKIAGSAGMTLAYPGSSQGISLGSSTELAMAIYNGTAFSFVETVKE